MSVTSEVYAGTGVAGSVDGDRLTTAQFNLLEGLAWAPDYSALYTTDNAAGTVRKIDASTGQVSTFASGIPSPEACSFDSNGDLWLGGGDSLSALIRIEPDGTKYTMVSEKFANTPRQSPLDGAMYFSVSLDEIRSVPLAGGATSAFVSGFGQIEEMRFDADGTLWVADFAADALVRVAPDGTKTTVLTGIDQAQGVAVNAAGIIYVSSRTAGRITTYNPATGASADYFSDLDVPNSVDFGADGALYVADYGAHVIWRLRLRLAPWRLGEVLMHPVDVAPPTAPLDGHDGGLGLGAVGIEGVGL